MEPIEEGHFYHIYNRGAGRSDLFWTNKDFNQFLEKYFYYLTVSVETYAYCLMKNHFHFLIRVRTVIEQETVFQLLKQKFPEGSFHGDQFENVKPFSASRQLAHLMNSYTKHVNFEKERTGTLIEGPVKRIRLLDEGHFNHLVCYIHRNPIHHKITDDYSSYPYSSYKEILSHRPTLLERNQLLIQFGDRQNFLEAHREFKAKLDEGFYLE